ncbi:hypothetical protein Taro_012306 [Colocasia esculenta]|uniref:Serine incorporator n=1 Tax=Colocasia esculenta TaxID=4460 RepID=A0A843UD84_COLES|nr:hypothetical protein [Colocasia esculenta]
MYAQTCSSETRHVFYDKAMMWQQYSNCLGHAGTVPIAAHRSKIRATFTDWLPGPSWKRWGHDVGPTEGDVAAGIPINMLIVRISSHRASDSRRFQSLGTKQTSKGTFAPRRVSISNAKKKKNLKHLVSSPSPSSSIVFYLHPPPLQNQVCGSSWISRVPPSTGSPSRHRCTLGGEGEASGRGGEEAKDVGGVVPRALLRGLRVRGLPVCGGERRPPLRQDRLLLPLRLLPHCLLGPPRGINHFRQTPDREWFETDAVLRVSLGNFLFFTTLAAIMVGVKDQKDPRDRVHNGGWMVKIFCWCILVILMFFVPNGVVSFYEGMSKFGSGLFLLVQVVLLLDFVHGWNDNWVSKDEQSWYLALLAVSLFCYAATFTFSGLLFHWFTPSGHDCSLNMFFILVTLALVFVFTIVALHPTVCGSLLPASVISLYCTYLCYSGLSSEPRNYECNGLFYHHHAKVSGGSVALGLLTTVLSVVYSAVRAGSSTSFLPPPSSPRAGSDKPLLPFDKVEEQEDDKKDAPAVVTYSYSFFNLIFSLASMYSAMLLTGWSTSVAESGKLVDVGWPSVWVRIATGWATAALYVWSLVAPLLFPDREF